MSITATYQLTNVDGVPATMAITMSISEWKRLREQLCEQYPSHKFAFLIDLLVRKSEATFHESCDFE